jgi:hypothetical protein
MFNYPTAVLLALAIALNQPAESSTVVRFNGEAVGGRAPQDWRCSSNGTQIASVGASLRWSCTVAAVLSCDPDGFEPFDVTRAQCGGVIEAAPRLARPIWFELPDLRQLTIEWRELSSSGTTLVARRQISPTSAAVSVPVASTPRILRVFRDGAAPISIWINSTRNHAVTLPPPEPGGELFVHLGGDITPITLHAVGAQPARLDVADREPSRVAVRPGAYDVSLLFRSQLKTVPVHVDVDEGATTEMGKEQFPPFGAADIHIDEEVLTDATTLSVTHRIEDGNGAVQISEVWAREAGSGRPRWLIDGLAPGDYEVVVNGDGTVNGVATFRVGDAVTTEVQVAKPTVRLVGNVKLGDQAAPAGTRLAFRLDGQQRTFETKADANGDYGVLLPQPGLYTAYLQTLKYFTTWTDDIKLAAGMNRFDWKIPGGSLEIQFRTENGARLEESVQLQIEGTTFQAAGPVTSEEAQEPVIIAGVPLTTELKVTASTPSSLIAEPVVVSLSNARPSATVVLNFKNMAATIVLRDRLGNLLPNATITAGNLILIEDPPSSGYYKVQRTAPGTGIMITAPNHVPVCRIFTPEDVPLMNVQLSGGQLVPAEIRLVNVKATRPVGFFLGLPASTCPVNLVDLGADVKHAGNETVYRFRLPAGTYQYAPYGRHPLQTFSVPGPPLVLTGPFK